MNCPKCGKERISDHTSFCSKCGLYLDFIEALIGNDGYPPDGFAAGESGSWLNRKNVRLTAALWFVVLTAFLLPISAIMGGPSEMLAVLGLMGPVGAAFLLVMSMFFPEQTRTPKRPVTRRPGENTSQKSLPSDRTVFAEDFVAPRRQTASAPPDERPPSVTEETTRHLDEKVKDQS